MIPPCPTCGKERTRRKPRGFFCNSCNNRKRKDWYKKDPRTVMLLSAKGRAKRDGRIFDLKKSDITIPSHCPILGLLLECGTRESHENAPTLERINPSGDYVKDNVIVISYRANRIKNDASLQELAAILSFFQSYNKS
jgi:hypothetical protein